MRKIPLIFAVLVQFLIACRPSETADYRAEAGVCLKREGEGFRLMRNQEPFFVRGVAGHGRYPLLRSIGANTIRTYDTVGLESTLDSAQAYGLAVVAGIPLPKSTESWFYRNDSLVEAYALGIGEAARRYAGHPALLLWCLGNEPLFYDFKEFNFPRVYNRFLDTLRKHDHGHPVAMGMANFSDRAIVNMAFKIPSIDLLVINTFGRLPKLQDDMRNYRWLWDKPYLVGEFGEIGPWEAPQTAWQAPLEPNSAGKAQRLALAYTEHMPDQDPRFLGALAFYWGQRQEVTHTWFNFFNQRGETSAALAQLAALYGHPRKGNQAPRIDHLFLDSSKAYNRFLFSSGSPHTAQAEVYDPDGDSLQWHWQIRAEDWFFEKSQEPPNLLDSSTQNLSELQFEAPALPGPYRLFLEVRDQKGHFASANWPFYVVR